MVGTILLAICVIFTSVSALFMVNDVGIKNNVESHYSEMMLDIVDERIINYYCNNAVLPESLSQEFLDDSGLRKEDVAEVMYVKDANGKSFTLSVIGANKTKVSCNSGKILPVISGYVDKTLVGVGENR